MGVIHLQTVRRVRQLMFRLPIIWHISRATRLNSGPRWGWIPEPGNIMLWSGGGSRLLILHRYRVLYWSGLSKGDGGDCQSCQKDHDDDHQATSYFLHSASQISSHAVTQLAFGVELGMSGPVEGNVLPSAKVTSRTRPIGVPFLATVRVKVISSPTLISRGDQPRLVREGGFSGSAIQC